MSRALVLVAQEEWKLTWEEKRGQLWIRHVNGGAGAFNGRRRPPGAGARGMDFWISVCK